MIFEEFEAEAGGLVCAGAERQTRIDNNADAIFGRGIVTPFRNQKESPANGLRLKFFAREIYPITFICFRNNAAELTMDNVAVYGIIEERADRMIQLDDAGRPKLPELGD